MSPYNDEGKWTGKPSAAPNGLYNPAYDKKKQKKASGDSVPNKEMLIEEVKKELENDGYSGGKWSSGKYDKQYEDQFDKTKKLIDKAKSYKAQPLSIPKKYDKPLTSKDLPSMPKLKAPSLNLMKKQIGSKQIKNPSGLGGKSVSYSAKSKGGAFLGKKYSSADTTGAKDLKEFKKKVKGKLKGNK